MNKDSNPRTDLSSNSNPIQKTSSKAYIPEEIYFDYKSYQIKELYLANLYKLVEIMLKDPSKSMTITGYADDGGSDNSNINLSSKRAEAVYKYLVVYGIDPKRIMSYGQGNSLKNSKLEQDSRIRKFNRKAIFEFK